VTSAAKRLLDEALALPAPEREKLVVALSDSLVPDEVSLSDDWNSEIQRRLEAVESGKVTPVPWEEAEARIRRALDRD